VAQVWVGDGDQDAEVWLNYGANVGLPVRGRASHPARLGRAQLTEKDLNFGERTLTAHADRAWQLRIFRSDSTAPGRVNDEDCRKTFEQKKAAAVMTSS
jgi:hypothetical protein